MVKLINSFFNNTIISNIKSVLGLNVFSLIINAFVGVVLVRQYGDNSNGILSYLSALFSVFSAVSSLGMDSLFSSELAKREYDAETSFWSAFFLNCVTSLLCYALFVFCSFMFSKDLFPLKYSILYGMGFLSIPFNLIQYRLQFDLQVEKYSRHLFGLNIFYALLRMLCAIFLFDFILIVVCFTIYSLLTALLFAKLLKRYYYDAFLKLKISRLII